MLYDCFAGISGDMNIGALVDVGVPADHLHAELGKLALAGEFRLELEPATKMGISGTRATVVVNADKPPHARNLADIQSIIESGGYAEDVTATAFGIFEHIAVAEAHIHDKPKDQIHFHEVGATDSIVDIVAAAICLDYLNVDAILCGPVELGGGMVRCEHGTFPVPAPATAEILQGVPCRFGGVNQEATTPTGAAILRQVVDRFAAPSHFLIDKTGYGIGQKDFPIPNVLRVFLGTERVSTESPYEREKNVQLECNIDDMSAEAFEPLIDRLLDTGAKEVILTPVVMKKSRPATQVSILSDPDRVDTVLDVLFSGSTTIGARLFEVEKHMLPREVRTISTSLGPVRVKLVALKGGRRRWKAEHDDVVRLAARTGVDYLILKDRINAELRAALDDDEAS